MQAHSTNRRARFADLSTRSFDVLVVGGGITGCGIARDATLRGLSVALVEKDDFASGTSSRSSRLVHGGVRYLETGQVHLVFEASAERRRLLRLAPHLVHPLAFTWPVYAGARISRWKLGAGLLAYDALAMFRNVARHERLTARGVLDREPMLRADGLRGGARYFDAATNDARLTLANAIGAAEQGATMLNHAAVTALRVDGGRVTGATVVDRLTGEACEARARVVVNATGPWSDGVAALDPASHDAPARGVRGSEGVHVAVPRVRIGNRAALTLLAPGDGRVVFVLPADAHAIIGTTDTYTSASPDAVRATNADVRYLLEAANAYFPNAALGLDDVVSAWAGIRPLVPSTSSAPGAVSREHAVTVGEHGLVSITGGKLTTFRLMAADVVRVVLRELHRSDAERRAPTAELPLPGGDFDSLETLTAIAARAIGDELLAARLVRAHGTRWKAVWREIQSDNGDERVDDSLPYTLGELRYAARAEMACTLGDLLIRRTHLAYESRDHGVGAAPRAARAVGPLLDWDPTRCARAVDEYAAEATRIFAVDA